MSQVAEVLSSGDADRQSLIWNRLLARLRADETASNRRILIVDQNIQSATRLRQLIEQRDYSVDVAHNLLETISLSIEHAYDVIILDATSQHGQNLTLVSQLRSLQRDAAFLLTVNAGEHGLPEGVPPDFGIAGTLSKPWQEDELRAALGRALALRSARQRHLGDIRSAAPTARSVLVVGSSLDAYRVQSLMSDSQQVSEVSVARSVAAGVRLLSQRSFTAVLTELNLPDACGLDAVVHLSAAAPSVPVIVYSNLDDEILAGEALQVGAQDVLFKHETDAKQLDRAIRHAVQRHHARQQLSHRALHDSLTNLANRTLLQQRLNNALSRARRKELTFAILYLDLDRFKWINDNLGHDAGDCVLQTVSERLMSAVREYDTVARLGGDEFAILLDTLESEAEAITVAERILRVMAEPIEASDQQLSVTTSIGISVYPGAGEQAEELIKAADRAMYSAKQRGRNGFQLSTRPPELAPRSSVRCAPGTSRPPPALSSESRDSA